MSRAFKFLLTVINCCWFGWLITEMFRLTSYDVVGNSCFKINDFLCITFSAHFDTSEGRGQVQFYVIKTQHWRTLS
jgi:hypothetical protein